MTEDKKSESLSSKKKAPAAAEKAVTKSAPARYVVAAGKALAAGKRILTAGVEVTPDDVADLEALIKGGFVIKA